MTDVTIHPWRESRAPPVGDRRLDEHVEGRLSSSIGPRLRESRQEQRLSLQQLAVRADVSAAAIHKIERNEMVPTITTLLKISAAFERPVTYFVEQSDGPPEPATVTTRASGRPVLHRHRGLSLAGISGRVRAVLSRRRRRHSRTGREQRPQADGALGEELVFVTEGALVFDIAGSRFELGPGDSLHFIGDQPHHWANEGKKPATAVWFALRDT